MKESVNRKEKACLVESGWKEFNIVLSGTLALLTFPSWASLFFAACCWLAWTDRPKQEQHGAG